MSDLDNLIDEWHDSDSQETLSKYLGVRDSDYKLWVEGKLTDEELMSKSKRITEFRRGLHNKDRN